MERVKLFLFVNPDASRTIHISNSPFHGRLYDGGRMRLGSVMAGCRCGDGALLRAFDQGMVSGSREVVSKLGAEVTPACTALAKKFRRDRQKSRVREIGSDQGAGDQAASV